MDAKTTLNFLIVVLLIGCVNTNDLLSDNQQNSIPDGAERIVYEYDGDKSELYDLVYTGLLRDGFRIIADNEEQGSITTDGKNVGQSTILRLQVFIEETNNGTSIANFRPEGKAGEDAELGYQIGTGYVFESDYETARWGDGSRLDRAYAYMLKFVSSLDPSNGQITHKTN